MKVVKEMKYKNRGSENQIGRMPRSNLTLADFILDSYRR